MVVRLYPVIAAGLAVLLISIDVQVFATACYAVVGAGLVFSGMRRGRLSEIGGGIHFTVVSWRAGILVFASDAAWWGDVHRLTIAIAAAMIVYDLQVERLRRSA